MAASADDIEEVVNALEEEGSQVDVVRSARFARLVREDLAAWREERRSEVTGSRIEAIRVPTQYSHEPELFIVFDTFAQVYLHPVITAQAVSIALESDGVAGRLESIVFSRFGEAQLGSEISADETSDALRSDLSALIALANDIGAELLGPPFNLADFLGPSE